MSQRKVRILMAKFGEGSEEAMLRLSRSFSEAGYEVIYTSTQDPQAIAISAVQESADHIGITTLDGATLEEFRTLFAALQQHGIAHIPVTAGGIFAEEELPELERMGLVKFFHKGTTYQELISWARANVKPLESD